MNKLQIVELISDPYDGPFEGEDFIIDEQGFIEISGNKTKLAALIMRKINLSKMHELPLVVIATRGDCIILGFDQLNHAHIVFSDKVGPNKDVLVNVKSSDDTIFYVYLNERRSSRVFKNLSAAKKFIRAFDKELQQVVIPEESYD